MKRVFKYTINQLGYTELYLPGGYQVLDVGFQFGVLTLWILVNETNAECHVSFLSVFTGQAIDEPALDFIGRAELGPLQHHVFEVL